MKRMLIQKKTSELIDIYRESLELDFDKSLEAKNTILNELNHRSSRLSKLLATEIEFPKLEASEINAQNLSNNQPIFNIPQGYYVSKRDTDIIEKWNSGKNSYESIAKNYGITRERIRQILAKYKRRGLFIESTRKVSESRSEQSLLKKINSTDQKKIQDQYLAGKPIRDILEIFSLSNPVLERILKDLTHKINNPKKIRTFAQIKTARENPDELTKYRHRIILKMRSENKSLLEIADELAISRIRLAQIIKNLKDNGVDVPNSSTTGVPFTPQELTERLNEIDLYLNQDKTIRQISKLMRMSPQHISNLIYKHLIKE